MSRYGIFGTLLLLLLSSSVSASNTCVPLLIQNSTKEIILPGPNQPRETVVYLFKNLTTHSIWVDHPVPHPSVSAGWSSYLRPGNLSALLVNRKNFTMNCATIKPGRVEYLDCAKVVSVCTPTTAVITSARKGTFWLVEDKAWDVLIKLLAKHGVQIK